METLKQVKNWAAAQTEFKTEIKPNSCTVWFHQGNGKNFAVKQTTKFLYVTCYSTNGHTNIKISTKKLTGERFPVSREAARELFSLYQRPQQTTSFTVYRGTLSAKVRITARAGHDYWQQCREKLEKRFGQLENFSPTSRTARLPENY